MTGTLANTVGHGCWPELAVAITLPGFGHVDWGCYVSMCGNETHELVSLDVHANVAFATYFVASGYIPLQNVWSCWFPGTTLYVVVVFFADVVVVTIVIFFVVVVVVVVINYVVVVITLFYVVVVTVLSLLILILQ